MVKKCTLSIVVGASDEVSTPNSSTYIGMVKKCTFSILVGAGL